MTISFKQRLTRLVINDSLVSGDWQLDVVSANDKAAAERAYVLIHCGIPTYIDRKIDNVIFAINNAEGFSALGIATPPSPDTGAWEWAREGAAKNPIWNYPLRTVSAIDSSALFAKPKGISRSTVLVIVHRKLNDIAIRGKPGIQAIARYSKRSDTPRFIPHYGVGGLYKIPGRDSLITYFTTTKIRERVLGDFDWSELRNLGYFTPSELRETWSKRVKGAKKLAELPVWTLRCRPVLTGEPLDNAGKGSSPEQPPLPFHDFRMSKRKETK